MYRRVSDFLDDWREESANTLKVLENITDETLKFKAYEGGRTLGFLAWHIVITIPEMMRETKLEVEGPEPDEDEPATIAEIMKAYKTAAESLGKVIAEKYNDSMLNEEFEIYNQTWTRSKYLLVLIRHEIHHRAQLTVYMRQAGLKVPGIYGPAKEEWVNYGMDEPMK